MDKSFENKLQQKLQVFEADVPSNAWQKIDHGLENPFENKLKSKLNGINAPVGAGTWTAIESKMPNSLENALQSKVGQFETPVNAGVWQAISQNIESMPGVFEDAIQHKLTNHQSAPPPHLAQNIFRTIDSGNSINWRKTISTVAAVFLLFTSMLFLPKQFNNGELKRSAIAFDTGKTNDMPTQLASILPINSKSANDNNYLNNGQIDNTQINSISSGHNIDQPNNGSSRIGNNYITSVSLGSNPANTAILNNSDGEYDNVNVKQLPRLKYLDLEYGPTNAKHLALMAMAAKTEDNFITTKPESKLNFGVMASSGTFAMNAKPNNVLFAYGESAAQFQNELYSLGSYNSLGASVARKISNKTNFMSGVNLTLAFNQMYFSIKANDQPTSLNSLVNDGDLVTSAYNPTANTLSSKRESELEYGNVDESILDGDSIIIGNNFSVTNQYAFIDLPLGFEVKLKEKQNASITARLGTKIRFMAGAHSYHINHDRDQIVEVNSAMSQAFYQTSLVGFGGVSYNHDLNDNYQIYFGPELNINATDLNKLGTWMSMKPVQLGLHIGIKQKIS
ncbi:MAG: hypothetical protein ACPGLV_02730 [Bacteroidia bacterium]